MNQGLQSEIVAVMPQVIATGLLVSLFTAQAPSGVYSQGGAPDGTYNDVDGLVNIACTAPPPAGSIQSTEVKALAEIAASRFHHVLLDKFYQSLDAGWRSGWRCMIGDNDGFGNPINPFAYDILGVEADSQSQMTRVSVKLVTL